MPNDPVRIRFYDPVTDMWLDVSEDNPLPVGAIGVVVSIDETPGTFVFDESLVAEQILASIVISERRELGSIWLDTVNLTGDITVRLYHKIDGTNFAQFQENTWIFGVDDRGILIDGFTAYRDVKIVLLPVIAGAGAVNVPFAIV